MKRRTTLREPPAGVFVRSSYERRAEKNDVVPWLRSLGFNAAEARHAAALCNDMPEEATLEQRVRLALSFLRPAARCVSPAPA